MKNKQIQNLKGDTSAIEKWRQIQEEEINQKMEVLQNRDAGEMNDDPNYLERQRENMMMEEEKKETTTVKHI
mgnify:CR=1 FL=1